jgi:hypothetical protein
VSLPEAPGHRGAATALEFSWAGQTARHVGTVAHDALRQVAEQGPDAWDAARIAAHDGVWRRALAALGVPGEELDHATRAVADALDTTLSDPRGRWLLDPGHRESRSEYAVSGVVGGELVNAVLDRTFVDAAGVRWIVDYKTGAHEGGAPQEFLDREQIRHGPQLETYARLMAALESRPTRLGLYFPAMGGWREWRAG